MIELELEFYDTIDSTNDELKRRMLTNRCQEGLVISAEEQTKGRGRSGHAWVSPKGTSVATSMVLCPVHIPTAKVSQLTLVAAIAVAEAIELRSGLSTQIKWPNDILISNKKVCGILTEMQAHKNQIEYVIVGIGVNVCQKEFPKELQEIATSLELEHGQFPLQEQVQRDLVCAIWERFLFHYEEFLQTQDLRRMIEGYNQRLVNQNRRVKVLDPQGAYEATAHSVNEIGQLVVEVEGSLRVIDSGEVSVRGLLGYV